MYYTQRSEVQTHQKWFALNMNKFVIRLSVESQWYEHLLETPTIEIYIDKITDTYYIFF